MKITNFKKIVISLTEEDSGSVAYKILIKNDGFCICDDDYDEHSGEDPTFKQERFWLSWSEWKELKKIIKQNAPDN